MAFPRKTTNPDALLKEVVKAATGGQTFKQATRAISLDEKESLGRSIGRDVDEWRAEFAEALRRTGSKLLSRLEESIDDIKPDALAYSLAVVADKASAIEGRNQVHAASVNIQVNNYGPQSKDDLLASLDGRPLIKEALNAANVTLSASTAVNAQASGKQDLGQSITEIIHNREMCDNGDGGSLQGPTENISVNPDILIRESNPDEKLT